MLGIGLSVAQPRISGGFQAVTSAFLLRFSVLPNSTYQNAYDRFVVDLQTGATSGSDLLSVHRALVLHAAPDAQGSLFDIRNIANPTLIGTPSFAAGRGYTGDGLGASTNRIDTQSNPTTNGQSQNNNSQWIWSGTDVDDLDATWGNANCYCLPKTTTTNLFTGRNTAAGSSNSANSNAKGMYYWGRNGSGSGNEQRRKNNGSLTVNSGAASAAPTNSTFQCLSAGGANNSVNEIGGYGICNRALTLAESTDVYNALVTYLTAIGYVF